MINTVCTLYELTNGENTVSEGEQKRFPFLFSYIFSHYFSLVTVSTYLHMWTSAFICSCMIDMIVLLLVALLSVIIIIITIILSFLADRTMLQCAGLSVCCRRRL